MKMYSPRLLSFVTFCADQGDKAAVIEQGGGQAACLLTHKLKLLIFRATDRKDEPPAFSKLLHQRLWNIRSGGGNDDDMIGTVLWQSERAVAHCGYHVGVTQIHQALFSQFG